MSWFDVFYHDGGIFMHFVTIACLTVSMAIIIQFICTLQRRSISFFPFIKRGIIWFIAVGVCGQLFWLMEFFDTLAFPPKNALNIRLNLNVITYMVLLLIILVFWNGILKNVHLNMNRD